MSKQTKAIQFSDTFRHIDGLHYSALAIRICLEITSGPFTRRNLNTVGTYGQFHIISWKCTGAISMQDSSLVIITHLSIYRGYYTVARRYEFYVRVARTISHEWAKLTREILFLPREHKIHIFELTCNVLFIIWRNQFNKSKRRESWRHWTIRQSQR